MEREFVFDADHLALDFLNTRRLVDGRMVDLLCAPGAIGAWLDAAGVLEESGAARLRASPPSARLLLSEARWLRDALLDAVTARIRGAAVPGPSLLVINRALESSVDRRRLDRAGPVDLRLEVTVERAGPLGCLARVATAAAELLTAEDPSRIRQCEADDCVLWFLDTSRNGSRKWCSMARCGNRAKVAAHYRRTHEG